MDLYAPPKVAVGFKAVRGGFAYAAIRIGLIEYALLELASAPFGFLASDRLTRVVMLKRQGVGGDAEGLARADLLFHDAMGTFHFIRGIAEVGLVVAFVAGLVWLHRAWAVSRSRAKKPTLSAGAVVLWTLVPVWGLFRLHGFILQIANWNGVSPEAARVDRWWWTLVLQVVVYFAMRHELEWVALVRALISAASALFGFQMVRALQAGLEKRNLDA